LLFLLCCRQQDRCHREPRSHWGELRRLLPLKSCMLICIGTLPARWLGIQCTLPCNPCSW
jgi:hypothetical protein